MIRRVLVLSVIGTAACLGPRSDPSSYYLVTPAAQAGAGAEVGFTLGIGPITLPGYLDRSEVVTRLSPNELTLSETDRWAEPLLDNVSRALSENLVTLVRPERYANYPWFESAGVDYAVGVDLTRFEADSTGNVTLAAAWAVRRGDGDEVLRQEVSVIEQPTTGLGTEPSVAALSAALARLAEEIAAVVRGMPGA